MLGRCGCRTACCSRHWRESATGSCGCRPALRSGHGGLGDGLVPCDPSRQREDVRGDVEDPPEERPRGRARRAVRSRSSCSARTLQIMRDGGGACRARWAPTRSTSTWAVRCGRCARREPGQRCSTIPIAPSRWRARPRGRGGLKGQLPVTVKLRSGLRRGEKSGFELAQRLVAEAGVAGDRVSPPLGGRAAQGHARLSLAERLVERLDAPVILTGGLSDAERVTRRSSGPERAR